MNKKKTINLIIICTIVVMEIATICLVITGYLLKNKLISHYSCFIKLKPDEIQFKKDRLEHFSETLRSSPYSSQFLTMIQQTKTKFRPDEAKIKENIVVPNHRTKKKPVGGNTTHRKSKQLHSPPFYFFGATKSIVSLYLLLHVQISLLIWTSIKLESSRNNMNNLMVNFRTFGLSIYLNYAMNLMIYDTILIKAGVVKNKSFDKRIASIQGALKNYRTGINGLNAYYRVRFDSIDQSIFKEAKTVVNPCGAIDFTDLHIDAKTCTVLGEKSLNSGVLGYHSWASDLISNLINLLQVAQRPSQVIDILVQKEFVQWEFIISHLLLPIYDRYIDAAFGSLDEYRNVAEYQIWKYLYRFQYLSVAISMIFTLMLCYKIVICIKICLLSLTWLLSDAIQYNGVIKVELLKILT